MKKQKIFYSVVILLIGLMCSAWTFLPAQEKTTPETYTIIFDRNTTAIPWDDETYEYTVTSYDANWQPVATETKTSVITVEYSENAYIAEAIPEPTREGYYFAGWQTRPVVTKADLINGVSPYQWYFGTQSRFGDTSTVMSIADMESLHGSTATLYARWVKMTDIDSEEDLRAISEDLNGAYRLTADITLTEDWLPIGCYFTNYEHCNEEWWTYAFKGTLDGNGHSISGLTVRGSAVDVSKYTSELASVVWHNDGDRADGCAGMFGATANANIYDLTLIDPVIDISGDYAVHGDYLYAAALSAFDMDSKFTNINVQNPTITVSFTDEASVLQDKIFISAGGVLGGGWSGYLTNCHVQGGTVEVSGTTTKSHGGEVYTGGIVGENYDFVSNCSSTAAIAATVSDRSTAEDDSTLKVNVGGLDAANTSATGCTVDAAVSVSVDKPVGAAEINVGGLTGAQRYQTAEGNTVNAAITTNCNLDPEKGSLHVGSVCGGLDVYYITQVLMYTPTVCAGGSNNAANVTNNGELLASAIGFVPELNGQRLGWINKGEYQMGDTAVPSNIEEVIAKYGSYLPAEYLMDGIIWLVTE